MDKDKKTELLEAIGLTAEELLEELTVYEDERDLVPFEDSLEKALRNYKRHT